MKTIKISLNDLEEGMNYNTYYSFTIETENKGDVLRVKQLHGFDFTFEGDFVFHLGVSKEIILLFMHLFEKDVISSLLMTTIESVCKNNGINLTRVEISIGDSMENVIGYRFDSGISNYARFECAVRNVISNLENIDVKSLYNRVNENKSVDAFDRFMKLHGKVKAIDILVVHGLLHNKFFATDESVEALDDIIGSLKTFANNNFQEFLSKDDLDDMTEYRKKLKLIRHRITNSVLS